MARRNQGNNSAPAPAQASRAPSRLWHKQSSEEEAARIGCELADWQYQLNEPRRQKSYDCGSMYEGVQLSGLDGDCFDQLVPVVFDGAPLINNRLQAVVDTLQAKLAALDEPRPQFVVTDGTYDQKRQAVWLDRFVEGQFYQAQGLYKNLWHLWRHAFLIAAAATGSVAVKVFADGKRIAAELHNTMDMWVDPIECRYGAPLTYGEGTWCDAEKLADENPKAADDIMRCAEAPPERGGKTNRNTALQVRVQELWRVATGENPSGKYLRAVGKRCLAFDDYPHATPPFAFYHFRQRLGGFWAASATDTVYQSVVREQQVLARMDEGEARSQTVIQYYDPNAMRGGKLVVPKHIVLIPYDADKGPPPPPFAPMWYPQQAPELMRIHAQNTHDTSGVNAMAANGQVQTGLTAAVAIRTVLSLLNERFAPRQRDIVQATAVDTAYLIARAAKEIYADHGSFDSQWHGSGFIRSLPGADCLDLPAEIYTAQVRPVSEKKNSPQDRIQLAQELVTQGIITGGDWVSVLATMDTPGASKKYARTEAFCEKIFDSFLHSKESELSKPGFYVSPPKLGVDLDYMMALGTDAYLSAIIDDVPETRRALFLKFIGDVNRKIDQRDQRRQALGLKPTAGAMPGQQQGQPATPQLPGPLSDTGPPQ